MNWSKSFSNLTLGLVDAPSASSSKPPLGGFLLSQVHRGNQKTGVISLILFCGSIWVSFSIVTMYSNPYKWAERIEPVPLSSLLQDLKSIQQ